MNKIKFDENGYALESGTLETHETDQDNVYIGINKDTHVTKGFGLREGSYLDTPEVTANENEAVIRKDNTWIITPDFRGQMVYKKTTGEAVIINKIGVVPDDLTDKPRPDEPYKWDSKKNDWVIDKSLKQESITNQNTTKKMELKATAEELIVLLERKDKLKRATPEDLTMLDFLYGFTLDLDDLDLTEENVVFPDMPSV